MPTRPSGSSNLRARRHRSPASRQQQRTPLRVEIPKSRYNTRIAGPIDYHPQNIVPSIGFNWLPGAGVYESDESDEQHVPSHVSRVAAAMGPSIRPGSARGSVALNVARFEGNAGGMV